jgi:hypothetical protein
VLNLVLESDELLDNLLALGNLLGVVEGANGAVDIVNGASLVGSAGKRGGGRAAEGGRTRIMGHRLRTDSLAKERGSEVTEAAGGG